MANTSVSFRYHLPLGDRIIIPTLPTRALSQLDGRFLLHGRWDFAAVAITYWAFASDTQVSNVS